MTEKELAKAFAEYDCQREGHVWIDRESGLLYTRDKTKTGTTSVFCRHCKETKDLEARGKETAPPPLTERVNEYKDLPAFKEIEAEISQSARLEEVGNETQ